MDWISWCMVLAIPLTIRAAQCPDGLNCTVCQDNYRHFIAKLMVKCLDSDYSIFSDKCQTHRVRGCYFPNQELLSCEGGYVLPEDEDSDHWFDLTLIKDSLRPCVDIDTVHLPINGSMELPEDFLDGFDNLLFLHLSNNTWQHFPEKFFGTPNLEVLDLKSNKIESLASTAFDNLQRLRQLNIANNRLVEILPGTFDDLVSLSILNIEQNNLRTLPSDIFAHLTELTDIELWQNNFTGHSLPAELFRHNDNLTNVYLFKNKKNMTTLPRGFFANLTKLDAVDLSENGFTSLPEDLFHDAKNLTVIRLGKNYLSTLPEDFFYYNSELYILDLSFNKLSHLPKYVFESQRKLETLDLSNNHLRTIVSPLFGNAESLKMLLMGHNKLETIDDNVFPIGGNLRVVDFSYNYLSDRILYPLVVCQDLEDLDLTHNNITEMSADWLWLQRLRVLNLSENHLRLLTDESLRFRLPLTIDVTHNDISRVDLWTAKRRSGNEIPLPLVVVQIENNPIRCDCTVYDLLRFNEGQVPPNALNAYYLGAEKLKCQDPRDYRNIVLADLKLMTFKCDVNSSEFKETRCPDKCKCYLRPGNKAFLVNCAYKGLLKAPLKLESPPGYHIEVNLTGNLLTSIPSFDQLGYNKVTVLALDHNKISSLSVDKFSPNLEVLQLSNNNLTRVNNDAINLLKNASSLRTLMLQANPWSCDCQALDFLKFVQWTNIDTGDMLKVNCFGDDKSIMEMSPEDLCPKGIAWIISSCLAVAFSGIIIGSLVALYYRYQREVKVWLYARQWCMWLITEDELDKDKLYDAFVSYSHKDEDFVVNDLVPKLENGPTPFKICMHFRDWLAGEWIAEQIARSVEQSRRTIVVLSLNFLESVWGRLEFRTAHSQALSEGRARVIVILYGDIGPTDDLDPELKAYLSMNTYVKWGDPWFWQKLRYALPHRPEFKRRNLRRTSLEIALPVHIENDSSESINLQGVLPIPPGTTTING